MRSIAIATIGLILAGYSFFACTQPATPPEKLIAQKLLTQVDSFALICHAMEGALDSAGGASETTSRPPAAPTTAPGAGNKPQRPQRIQQLFLDARLAYKRFEWAAEYFDPTAAHAVNGPPVPEAEMSGLVVPPTGLQVIETFLFPIVDTAKKAELRRQTRILLAACEKYKSHFANIDIFDWQVFDAAKLEVFRVMTLGITGFDDPLTLHSTAESAAALQSLQAVLAHYPDKTATTQGPAPQAATAKTPDNSSSASGTPDNSASGTPDNSVAGKISAATHYLSAHPDFNSFDRATFITNYANPLTTAISDQETALAIHVIRYNRLLNQDAKTLFDTTAFNVNAYSPDPASFITPAKITLGERLFTDASLSSTGTRSCQSCHQPAKAFTDGLVKNTVLGRNDPLPRNTPTLLNAALQPAQFYDMRVGTLEEQSLSVVQNNAEMHGSMKLSVQRLWQDTAYRRLFTTAFPRKDRTGIDTLEVMNAIGSYVRSLVALDSRFDRYMRGDHGALTTAEVNGFNLFMGKARCGTCHYMPIFNGAFPPRFVKTDAEVIGVPATQGAHAPVDADRGRYAILPAPSFQHAFKTPSVRNAARTAPYMHNGVFTTLEQVIDFYDKGGGAGLGLHLDNQTLPFDKLGLTPPEKSDLIAFIKSLDSRQR